ncbi:MAG TPA: DAK2 domain-containing protein [Actinomycetota bacterium]|nr:DAK2 domain-containing protein [Actinomycetota bacterium]
MGADTTLPVSELRRLVEVYADALTAFQEEINALNVFPVPDGDTGTNMRLTVEAVRRELEGADDVPAAIVRGSLMGARGNSGVILSQVLRGLCERIAEADEMSGRSIAEGLRAAADRAYGAVLRPQEGTILTVAREAADAAGSVSGSDAVEVVRHSLERAREALARTPELLPVLAQAGVVDAGGRGLVLLLESLLNTLDGTPLPEPRVDLPRSEAGAAAADGGSLEYPFEVQMLLYADDDTGVESYRRTLDRLGDCVLVVGGSGVFNVHVHTDDVGAVIEEALEVGRPRQIEVTYMQDQVAEVHTEAVLARMRGEGEPEEEGPLTPLGVVAVAAGDGILAVFRSLGVRGLVPGGQTFNPSAEEIIRAVRAARAEQVIVLPNNKNVIASARTAAQVAVEEGIAKRVEVIPTESPLQAFTALLSFDQEGDLDAVVEAMSAETERTRHGEVAYAVRSADTPVGHVERGQCLGMRDGQVVTIGDDPAQTVMQVLEEMVQGDGSLVTLVYGEGIDEWSAHELGKRVADAFGGEVEVHRGGQPHYPYLIGVE